MRQYDALAERFCDALPLHETPAIPGQYAPLDIALYNPCGIIL